MLLLFLVTHALLDRRLRWEHAVTVGLVAAAGFGASIWVGGIAFILALPLLFWALRRLRLDYAAWRGPLLLAVAVCVVVAWPVLTSVLTGPGTTDGLRLAVTPYPATAFFDRDTPVHIMGHVVLYWAQFLPLCLGIIYALGLFALAAGRQRDQETRIFHEFSVAAIAAYLLIVQWVESAIVNNDLGWRAVAVPIMLLQVWAAVALAEIPALLSRWHRRGRLHPSGAFGVALISVAIVAGLSSGPRLGFVAHEIDASLSPGQLAWHRDLMQQRDAWAALRRHTAPADLVQNNPDTYATVVTRWSAPASAALFADRPLAYSEPVSVNAFAYSYDEVQRAAQYAAVQAVFASNPAPGALAYARDTLRIKAILLDQRDSGWPGGAIEQSGFYKLVESGENYRIFVSTPPPDPGRIGVSQHPERR